MSLKLLWQCQKKLKQSRRKIYYHLDKINDDLPDGIEKIVSYLTRRCYS